MDFFSANEVVADLPENWKIGREKAGAAVFSRSVSLAVSEAAVAVEFAAAALRVVEARIAACAMMTERGIGVAGDFARWPGDVLPSSGAASSAVGGAVGSVAGGIAMPARMARKAIGSGGAANGAGGVAGLAPEEAGPVGVEVSSCFCRISANLAEGSFGAGATAVAEALGPGVVAGRKPSDVLPEYAFMVSCF